MRKKDSKKRGASSSQAQQFLRSTGETSNLADAFSRFKNQGIAQQSPSSPSGEIFASSFDSIDDALLRQHFKHLTKKDPLTRQKALQQISSAVQEIKDQSVLIAMLPEWTNTMRKLCVDNSKRVRELGFLVFKHIVHVVKKELGPFLKQIMPYWFVAMQDTEREVKQAALDAFHTAFLPEKRANVIEFCKDEILDHLRENLLTHTLQTLGSSDMTKVEAEERYGRIVCSTVLALCNFVQVIQDKNQESLVDLFKQPNFWKFLTIKEYPLVRASMFRLVKVICLSNPNLLLVTKNQEETVNSSVSLNVIGCFNETSLVVHADMVESLLTLLKTFSQTQIWGTEKNPIINPSKAVFPRFFSFLRNAATSSPSSTFASLLPFISFLNYQLLGGTNAKSSTFFDQFFTNLWLGFCNPAVTPVDSSFVAQAMVECLMFVILSANKFVQEDAVHSFQEQLVQKFLINRCIKYYVMKREIRKEDVFCSLLCKTINKMISKPDLIYLVNTMFQSLNTIGVECLSTKPAQVIIPVKGITIPEQPIQELSGEAEDPDLLSTQQQKPEKKEDKVVEEKLVCEDRNLVFPQRFGSLLNGILVEISPDRKKELVTRVAKLFNYAINNAKNQETEAFLRTATSICTVVPLHELVNQEQDLFTNTLLPMFNFYVVDQVAKDKPIVHELLTLVSHLFVHFPSLITQLFDQVVIHLFDKPISLLYVMETCDKLCRTAGKDHVFEQTTIDSISFDNTKRAMNQKDIEHFKSYINLTNYLLTHATSEKITVQLLDELINYLKRRPKDVFIAVILDLIESVIVHAFNTQYSSLIGYIRSDIMTIVFEYCMEESHIISYISQEFIKECSLFPNQELSDEKQKDEHKIRTSNEQYLHSSQSSDLGKRARKVWNTIGSTILTTISEDTKQAFAEQEIAKLKGILFDASSLNKYSHSAFVNQAKELFNLYNKTWDQILYCEKLWEQASYLFTQVMQPVSLGSTVVLVPSVQVDQHKHHSTTIVNNMQLYARFISFAIESMQDKVDLVFVSNEDALEKPWIIIELLNCTQCLDNLIFHSSLSSLIQSFITKTIFPRVIWRTETESDCNTTVQSTHFVERIQILCDFLLHTQRGHEQKMSSFYAQTMKTLIQTTLKHLKQINLEHNFTIATKFLRDLFKQIYSKLFTKKTIQETIASVELTRDFHVYVDALFSITGDRATIDYAVQKVQLDEQLFNPMRDQIITWLGQLSSMIMEVTEDMKNRKTVESSSNLSNMLTLQSGLVILFNHMIGSGVEQDEIKVSVLVDLMRDFTDALLDSPVANDYIDFIDFIFAKLLHSIIKHKIGETIQISQYELVVILVEQHVARFTSIIEASAKVNLEVLRTLFYSLYNMIDMAGSFLSSLDPNDSFSIASQQRIYLQLLYTFTSLYQFNKNIQTEIFSRAFRRVVMINIEQLCTVLQDISSPLFTMLDQDSNFNFSQLLCEIMAEETTGPLASATAAQLLCKHLQLTTFFPPKTGVITQQQKFLQEISASERVLYGPLQKLVQTVPCSVIGRKKEPLRVKYVKQFVNRDHELFWTSESPAMLSYLLSWHVLLHMYETAQLDHKNSAMESIRAFCFEYIKEEKLGQPLLDILFCYVLGVPDQVSAQQPEIQLHPPLLDPDDLVNKDCRVALLHSGTQGTSTVDHDSMTLFAAQLLYKILLFFPSLARLWFKTLTDTHLIESISKFVTEKVTPLISTHELHVIWTHAKQLPAHISIKTGNNYVIAVYTQDEVQLDINLVIPSNYPLSALEIKSSKRVGVQEAQWRKWILKMTTILFTQTGSVWDALVLWQSNLEKHFEGVEPCPICYSIVHTGDFGLPKVSCQVCSNRYHAACLYKWINTSGNSSCPTCRSTNSFTK